MEGPELKSLNLRATWRLVRKDRSQRTSSFRKPMDLKIATRRWRVRPASTVGEAFLLPD